MWQYNELYHHGILGQKWGVRRYRDSEGHLTNAGKKRLAKKDAKWAKKNNDKIMAKAKKASMKELNAYGNELMSMSSSYNSNGKLNAKAINSYNQKMAELMTQKVSDLSAPSGKVVSFVAKRGEVGVYMALSDPGYDYSKVKNGVYSSGRVAYKQNELNKINI